LPPWRALAGARYSRFEDLTKVTEGQLKQLHGIGPKALATLRDALAAQGMAFPAEEHQIKKDRHG
jgi:hypothetical protein